MVKLPHWPLMRGYRDIELGLARVEELLHRLGNPETTLPPIIHVAGTNGKGSTLAFLRAMLEEKGLRCHVYTSPHLIAFNERIVLAGEEISDDFLLKILDECKDASGDLPITFFEGTTIAALLAFSKIPADIVLLETGLGGRLDATNVIAHPTLTIITPIDMDHQDFLGDTLTSIAGEKAGIIKQHVPCVVAPQTTEVMQVLEHVASSQQAPLIKSTPITNNTNLGLRGDHQRINAGVAITAYQQLQRVTPPLQGDIPMGALAKAQWRARLQHLMTGSLATLLPSNCELWLDGGHNPAAGKVLADYAKNHWQDKPLYAITSMLQDKDAEGFLSPLASQLKEFYAIPLPQEGGYHPLELMRISEKMGIKTSMLESVNAALQAIVTHQSPPYRVLICGSLYLAGSVLTDNNQEIQ